MPLMLASSLLSNSSDDFEIFKGILFFLFAFVLHVQQIKSLICISLVLKYVRIL